MDGNLLSQGSRGTPDFKRFEGDLIPTIEHLRIALELIHDMSVLLNRAAQRIQKLEHRVDALELKTDALELKTTTGVAL